LLCPPGAIQNATGGPFRVFTPFWRRLRTRLAELPAALPAPRRLPALDRAPMSLPLDELQLLPAVRWDAGLAQRWQPGEAGARRRLVRFVAAGLAHYVDARERPGEPGTSSLSPHLHFGEVSPRQVYAALQPLAGTGSEAFLRQLGWREFAAHLLHHFPHTASEPLDARYAGFDWRDDCDELAAWQQGRTGFPIIDAGMHELWHTGWMHNRVRMITASFLTRNLLMDWRAGARWFHDTLVDADLANNTLGWQWAAGCGADAAPWFRIFNPVLQGRKFDPTGRYVRRWLPELVGLPDRWLHEPWAAPARLLRRDTGRWPPPLVDLAASRARALAGFRHHLAAQRLRSPPA
jgi:deoxyribodipyrimidine photo-lyase